MANYIGVKCPVCTKRFTQTDDIVVCPVCGAPHHRECYTQRGQCIFAEEHLSGKEWHASPEDTTSQQQEAGGAVQKCSRCGSDNPPDSLFCQVCGHRLGVEQNGGYQQQAGGYYQQGQQPGQDSGFPNRPFAGYGGGYAGAEFNSEAFRYGGVAPDSVISGEQARDVATYVGANTAYYMPRFRMFGEGAPALSVNFSAVIFNFFYFFYRKMHLVGILLLGLSALSMVPYFLYMREMLPETLADPSAAHLLQALEEFGTPFTLTTADINYELAEFYRRIYTYLWGIKLVARFAVAAIANRLYYKKAIKDVFDIRQEMGDAVEPSRYSAELARSGGVSMMAVVAAIALSAISYIAIGSAIFSAVL